MKHLDDAFIEDVPRTFAAHGWLDAFVPHPTLSLRRLRMLLMQESAEALRLAAAAGMEKSCARPTI